jgi:hypothetical protein
MNSWLRLDCRETIHNGPSGITGEGAAGRNVTFVFAGNAEEESLQVMQRALDIHMEEIHRHRDEGGGAAGAGDRGIATALRGTSKPQACRVMGE